MRTCLVPITALLGLLSCANITYAQMHPQAPPLPLPKRQKTPMPEPQPTAKPVRAQEPPSASLSDKPVTSNSQPKPQPKPLLDEVVYLAPGSVPVLPAGPKKYLPPDNFNGRNWGAPRSHFDRLPAQPETVSVAFSNGERSSIRGDCISVGDESVWRATDVQSPDSKCNISSVLRNFRPNGDGSGFHALSEYVIEGQGFKFSKTGVLMHPVVYEFCAHWEQRTNEKVTAPENLDELNRFCGVRLSFETEALSQLRDLPADHVTRYDLVLAELNSRYGKPAGSARRGRVDIEPTGDKADSSARPDRRFSTYRWCPAPYLGLESHCEVSIVLSLDPQLGRGMVLFATPALWQYAYARESSTPDPDSLFMLMHAISPNAGGEKSPAQETDGK
jgi:hypothetical protein